MRLANDIHAKSGDWWLDRGKWYPTHGSEPFHQHNRQLPFDHLGLLQIAVRNQSVTISWDVDRVDEASLTSCLEFLAGREPDTRVTLRFCKNAWAKETHNPMAAIRRIEQIWRFRGIEFVAKTRIRQRELSEITRNSPLIAAAFKVWHFSGSSAALKADRIGSYGLYFAPRGDGLVFEQVGENSECRRVLGDEWKRSAVGTPADSAFADSTYDQRVSTRYQMCLDESVPVLEDIHGYVDLGAYAIWMPYQRVLLPTSEGIACFTKITEDIQIPFLSC
jgi:hypothetical protein